MKSKRAGVGGTVFFAVMTFFVAWVTVAEEAKRRKSLRFAPRRVFGSSLKTILPRLSAWRRRRRRGLRRRGGNDATKAVACRRLPPMV